MERKCIYWRVKSKALVRIEFNNGEPFEAERFSWSNRVSQNRRAPQRGSYGS
jgi:hypothetical protein